MEEKLAYSNKARVDFHPEIHPRNRYVDAHSHCNINVHSLLQ